MGVIGKLAVVALLALALEGCASSEDVMTATSRCNACLMRAIIPV